MISTTCAIMSWNVRGLNSPGRRVAVREIADAHRVTILCLQDTKLENWTPSLVREVGGTALEGCVVLPAMGTRGGAAILWSKDTVDITTHAVVCFSITAKVSVAHCSSSFWLTTVYGRVDDARKDAFLAELVQAAPPQGGGGMGAKWRLQHHL